MIGLNIAVSVNTASPALDLVRAGLENDRLLPFFGEIVAQEMTANFLSLDQSRVNKLGGERTGFFSEAAARVNWRETEDGSVFVYSDQVGLALKFFGGVIAAKEVKYLTIPATSESYGRRAKDFADLKVLFGANGPYGLGRITKGSKATMGEVYGEPTTETHEVLFFLKQRVEISPDPTMLPSATRLEAKMRIGFNDYMALLWENAAAGRPKFVGGAN